MRGVVLLFGAAVTIAALRAPLPRAQTFNTPVKLLITFSCTPD